MLLTEPILRLGRFLKKSQKRLKLFSLNKRHIAQKDDSNSFVSLLKEPLSICVANFNFTLHQLQFGNFSSFMWLYLSLILQVGNKSAKDHEKVPRKRRSIRFHYATQFFSWKKLSVSYESSLFSVQQHHKNENICTVGNFQIMTSSMVCTSKQIVGTHL